MHPAQCSLAQIEREAALHIAGIESVGCKLSLTKGACEKTAMIRVFFQLDDKCTRKLCGPEDDGSQSPLGNTSAFLTIRLGLRPSRPMRLRSNAGNNPADRLSADAGCG